MRHIRYSDFEAIEDTIGNILSSPKLSGKLKRYSLHKVWGQVVGKRFENRSYPESLMNKILKVACENAQITSELVMNKRMIAEKLKPLAKTLGLEIEDIIFSHKIWKPID